MEEISIKWTRDDILKLSLVSNNLANNFEIFNKYDNFINFTKHGISRYYPAFEHKLFEEKQFDINKETENIKNRCEKYEINYIALNDEKYPKLLREINNPPLILYYKGNIDDSGNRMSIVGTRRCTEYGKLCTELFTEAFVNAGLTIVSGLATGIDTISHLSAIAAGGKTFAVIAGGVDKISPQTTLLNAEKIIEAGGAVISTYKPGVTPLPTYFLQRNRIISGLSQATLVVESNFKGGSLNTARNANEQNREVYAVPGRINSDRSKGTNKLIWKNTAKIAVSPEDILEDLGYKSGGNLFTEAAGSTFKDLSEKQALILSNIESEQINADKLSELTGLNIPELLNELLHLEFMGLIRQLPGKNYVKFNI